MKKLMLLMLFLGCAAATAQSNCTMQNLAGTYVISYSGYLAMTGEEAPPPMYATIFGVASVGFDGTISGGATMNVIGYPSAEYVVPGELILNSDCTGTLELQPYPEGHPELAESETDRFVFDKKSHTMMLTIVSAGPGLSAAALGSWNQISPVPNAATW